MEEGKEEELVGERTVAGGGDVVAEARAVVAGEDDEVTGASAVVAGGDDEVTGAGEEVGPGLDTEFWEGTLRINIGPG
jgi:hypothetical protein